MAGACSAILLQAQQQTGQSSLSHCNYHCPLAKSHYQQQQTSDVGDKAAQNTSEVTASAYTPISVAAKSTNLTAKVICFYFLMCLNY